MATGEQAILAENDSAVATETMDMESTVPIIQEGVEPRVLLMAGAGQGLFATRAFRKGELKLGDGKYVDARECPHVLAGFINDCRSRGSHNVSFDKRPQENVARVVALRDISPDEELYVDYGRFYWLGYNLLHPENPIR